MSRDQHRPAMTRAQFHALREAAQAVERLLAEGQISAAERVALLDQAWTDIVVEQTRQLDARHRRADAWLGALSKASLSEARSPVGPTTVASGD